MPSNLPKLRDAIAAHQAQQIPSGILARSLITHRDWSVPCRVQESRVAVVAEPDDSGDGPIVRIFSDKEALQTYETRAGRFSADQQIIRSNGFSIFGELSASWGRVDVNPLDASGFHYKTHQFGHLRDIARAVQVEQVLWREGDWDDGFGILARYTGYHIIVTGPEDAPELMLAPDDRGRRFAAVFTAQDTLRAFVEQMEITTGSDAYANPRTLQLDGRALFAQVAQLPFDGIVFNCAGPVNPRPVAADLARLVRDQT